MPTLFQAGSYVFGASSVEVTGMEVEEATIETTVQFEAEGLDSEGAVVAFAIGDGEFQIQASGYANGAAPSIGQTMTAGGNTCVITSVSERVSNREWKKLEVRARGFEGVSM